MAVPSEVSWCSPPCVVSALPEREAELGDAEIEHLDGAVGGDEQVGRLDVAMHHALAMRGIEGAGEVAAEGEHLVDGHRSARQPRRQRLAVEQLHHHELPALVLADVVERADVGVVQRRDDAGFALEALGGGRVAAQFGRQQLHGDATAQPHVLGGEHLAHGAAAERRENPVMRQRLADHAGA